jgi:hypothetical protein
LYVGGGDTVRIQMMLWINIIWIDCIDCVSFVHILPCNDFVSRSSKASTSRHWWSCARPPSYVGQFRLIALPAGDHQGDLTMGPGSSPWIAT